jgi:hypothetical protein
MAVKNGTVVIAADGNAPTGTILSFSAEGQWISALAISVNINGVSGTQDPGRQDGQLRLYHPGTYTVTLTVTDNRGCKTETTQTISIIDNRPDLFVEALTWSPETPGERCGNHPRYHRQSG